MTRTTHPLVLALALTACAGSPATADCAGRDCEPSSTQATGTGDEGQTSSGGGLEALELPPAHSVNTGKVATADTCESCHSNAEGASAMRDSEGRPIAPYDLWRATMMANSARDPFWHAMVEAEVLATPSAAEAIEAKCMRCHAPLLAAELELGGLEAPGMQSLHTPGSDHAALGLDGVSCTLCHQIEDQELGEASTFSGAWPIAGAGRSYGPHAAPFEMPMLNHVELQPVAGPQLRDSGLCATCHTLSTDALRADGTAIGASLPEQTPYLEWQHSAFSTEGEPGPAAAECQDCHVPQRSVDGVPIVTRIARRPMGDDFPPVSERQPYGRHVFVGGNTTMLALIRDQAATLNPHAPEAAFEASIAATREQLQHATASLELGDISREGQRLRIPVSITSLAGHKLPTGFPSRRVFLRVEVRDGSDALVFRSGAFDARGRLLDPSDQVLPEELAGGPLMPHLDVVDTPDRVQIWEAVMVDESDAPTYRLLRGVDYIKDNRVLPAGWDPATAPGTITPRGVGADPDFQSAGDTLTYLVDAPADAGPYTLTVEAYYQALSPRFLAELFVLEGPKIAAFEAMLDGVEL